MPSDGFVFREVLDPRDVVALLRLRHKIYFEEERYGPGKALRLDLTVHDAHSRLFGVFQGESLVGGMRLVKRDRQPLAALFDGLRTIVGLPHEEGSNQLPSEEAFDLGAALGSQRELVDAEVGRFALDVGPLTPWLVQRFMLASLAAAQCERCRLYLYSCAITNAAAYARVARPRFVLAHHAPAGIASDGFAFPKPTVAAVAAVEDSPYAHTIEKYAAILRREGSIDLSARVERSHPLRRSKAPLSHP